MLLLSGPYPCRIRTRENRCCVPGPDRWGIQQGAAAAPRSTRGGRRGWLPHARAQQSRCGYHLTALHTWLRPSDRVYPCMHLGIVLFLGCPFQTGRCMLLIGITYQLRLPVQVARQRTSFTVPRSLAGRHACRSGRISERRERHARAGYDQEDQDKEGEYDRRQSSQPSRMQPQPLLLPRQVPSWPRMARMASAVAMWPIEVLGSCGPPSFDAHLHASEDDTKSWCK